MAFLTPRGMESRNLAQAAAPQEPVNSAGYAPGEGWGASHNLSGPEAQVRVTELAGGAQRDVAETQAGAHRYGADIGLKQAAVQNDWTKTEPGAMAGFQNQKDLIDAKAKADPLGVRTLNLATAAGVENTNVKTGFADAGTAYRKSFQSDHGVYDPKTGIPGPPADENLSRIYQKGLGYVNAGTHTPDEAYQAIQPDIQKHYYTPENVDRALNSISQRTGQPITPAWRANAMSGSPEAMSALYPEIRSTLSQPKPGLLGSAARNLTTPTNPFAPTP